MSTIKLTPSILAADFARLGEQVRETEAAGADRIHVDVMDGHFVPNISMGPVVVQALRPVTKLPLEVHLMIEEPGRYIEPFAKAGADSLLVHVELPMDLMGMVARIKALGKKAGVVINPPTAVSLTDELVREVDLILVMTVHPGFGGQAFMPEMLEKVSAARDERARKGLPFVIEVDGGIVDTTAREARVAGADVFVAGHAVFRAPDARGALAALRAAVGG